MEETGLVTFETKQRRSHPELQTKCPALPKKAEITRLGWQRAGVNTKFWYWRTLKLPTCRLGFGPDAAGVLPAALSTARLLLAISFGGISTTYQKMIKPDISDKGEMLAARYFMAVAIAVATWLGNRIRLACRAVVDWPWYRGGDDLPSTDDGYSQADYSRVRLRHARRLDLHTV